MVNVDAVLFSRSKTVSCYLLFMYSNVCVLWYNSDLRLVHEKIYERFLIALVVRNNQFCLARMKTRMVTLCQPVLCYA